MIVKIRDSLLTTSSGYTNYRGILNLIIILLVLSNARAALENIIKYGILVDPLSWFRFLREGRKHWPALLIVLGLSVHIIISLLIEKLIVYLTTKQPKKSPSSSSPSKQQKLITGAHCSSCYSMRLTQLLLFVNLVACISLPPIAVYTNDTHPISTSAALMLVSIVFLKLLSFHMMNFWCRDVRLPEGLQSRTTSGFMRSYVPPALDFGAVQLPISPNSSPKSSSCSLKSSSDSSPTSDLDLSPSRRPIGSKIRQRIKDIGSNVNVNNNSNGNSSTTEGNNNNNTKEVNKGESSSAAALASNKEHLRQLILNSLSRYPENLNVRDMCAFMCFPTLCYELEFPLCQRIRKRFLLKRLCELIILSQMDMALIQQWIVPTVSNSVLPFRQMQFSHMLERLLKLAIPNHVIWLIWFYLFFHSLLNIVAELTRYADREFYRDWWNSESVYYFWSNWNLPVHKWCARHLYVPLISLGLSKCQASTGVFFVSAFFHEYLVSVPLKLFRMWAFTGMLIQLPWARFVSSYFNSHLANVAVWMSLIIGQPLCILMYYHDYYVINNIKSLPFR